MPEYDLRKIIENANKQPSSGDWAEYVKKMVDFENERVGKLNLYDGYNCDLCKNRGYFAKYDENDGEVRVSCKCMKTRNVLKRAQKSGLGNVLKENTFNKFVCEREWQTANKRLAMEFCEDETAKWFFIGGQVGCGKTHLCTAISGHYIKAGYDTLYMLWCEDSKRIKACISDADEYKREIERYKNIPVLYIDDFLKVKKGEEPSPADINLAFEIINSRVLDPEKVTIISSEKTLSELLAYDEATMSRIYQKCGKYKINIAKDINKNYRLKD